MTNSFTKKSARMSQLIKGFLVFILLSFSAAAFSGSAVVPFAALFAPDTIGPGSVTTLTYTINNSSDSNPVTDLAFINALPTDVNIATPANASSNCGGAGILTAPDGGDTINFTDGSVAGSSTCSIKVDVTSSNVTLHTNTTGALTSSAGTSGTATDDLNVVNTLPGFSKSFSPAAVNIGARSTLTFTIDNTLNGSDVANLDFTDNLPAGMVVASPANTWTDCVSSNFPDTTITAHPGTGVIVLDANGNNIVADSEVLSAGAMCTVTVDVTATGIGKLINSTEQLLADFVASGKANAELEVTRSTISLVKSFLKDPVAAGATVDLEFTIRNYERNETAINITFSDDLDATLTGLTTTGTLPNNPCGSGSTLTGGSTITLTGGNLAAGADCTFTVPLAIPGAAVTGDYPNTTSAITAVLGDSGITGDSASDVLFVQPAPLLTKTFSPDIVGMGDTVSLNFNITNTSTTSAATDISFSDNISAFAPGAVVSSLPAPGFCGAGSTINTSVIFDELTLDVSGANLLASGNCSFSIDVIIPNSGASGIFTNTTTNITATIDANIATGQPASNDLTVVPAPRLRKSFTDDPVLPGETVTLEFTLSHDSTALADASNIAFTDDLTATVPALADLAASGSATNNCGGTFSGTTNLSLTGGGPLAPGASCTITIPVSVPDNTSALPGRSYTNTTSNVTATVSGISVTGTPAQDNLNITGLVISKEFTDDPVLPGGIATLMFTIDNSSSALEASNITFTDDVNKTLPGMTIVPSSVSPNACGGSLNLLSTNQILQLTGGSIPAGASCNFSITLQVPGAATSGSFSNRTSVNTAFVNGQFITLAPAADVLNVFSDPLILSKSFTDDPATPGGIATLLFTLGLDATAPGTADTISFTDDLNATLAGLKTGGMTTNNCGGSFSSSPSGTGELLSLTGGGPLNPGDSCTIIVPLSVPAGSIAGNFVNSTSTVTGEISGLGITGLAATDTLNVTNPSVTPPPGFSKSFLTNPSVLGSPVTLRFDIDNSGSTASANNLELEDNFPTNMVVANPANSTTTCPGAGTITAVPGTSVITYTGGSVAGMTGSPTSCSLQVDIVTTTRGVFTNTSDNLFSTLGNSGTASDTLTVNGPPAFSKSFSPATIDLGATSTLTFTIDTTGSYTSETSNLAFTDTLPTGMTIASVSNAVNNCTGGTLTAVSGSSTISYTNGSLADNSSCTISVDVTASVNGTLNNTSGNLTSTSGDSGTASASLTVNSLTSATAPTATGTGDATIEIIGSADCNILEYSWITPPSPPSGRSFPHGLFQFRAGPNCVGSTTFQFTLPTALMPDTQLWKFGPTPDNSTPHWYQLPVNFTGNMMSFNISDGGIGDHDLIVGQITDPGGPTVFTTTVPIPVLSTPMRLILICLLALIASVFIRQYAHKTN